MKLVDVWRKEILRSEAEDIDFESEGMGGDDKVGGDTISS